VSSCAAPPAHVEAGGDCDDGDDRVSPAATEICNRIDDDCDDVVDDGASEFVCESRD
jgi:hypothetical protein